jgi:hypothetical protein
MSSNESESTNKKTKRPAWSRTIDIILRTAHVAVTSVLFGGAVCGISFATLMQWHNLAIFTGCTLVASEIYHCRHWLYQGRGLMVIIHVGLLGIIHVRPDLMVPVLTAVLIFGMAGSHMPKSMRYWSFIHGRVLD